MPSHYSSIGLMFRSEDEFEQFTSELAERGDPIATRKGTYLRCTSESGAELWLQVNRDNELIGAHPHFRGESSVAIKATERIHTENDTDLDGAFEAWANATETDDGDYPLVFDAANFYEFADVVLPAVGSVQVAAFAQSLTFWKSEEAYDTGDADEVKFAAQSFVPGSVLTQGDEPPPPEAMFTGIVRAAERRTNEWFGADFFWISVATLGATFDVVADPALLPDLPSAGGVLQGTFWLSGHVRALKSNAGLAQRFFQRLRK